MPAELFVAFVAIAAIWLAFRAYRIVRPGASTEPEMEPEPADGD